MNLAMFSLYLQNLISLHKAEIKQGWIHRAANSFQSKTYILGEENQKKQGIAFFLMLNLLLEDNIKVRQKKRTQLCKKDSESFTSFSYIFV